MPVFDDQNLKDLLAQRQAALGRNANMGGLERKHIIQETSPVVERIRGSKFPKINERLLKFKHRWVTPTKRWVSSPRNRLGILAGLAGMGFLGKIYQDSKPEEVIGVNQEDYDPYNPYMSALYEHPHMLNKQSASTTYAFTPLQPPTPKPVGFPSVSAPKPGASITSDKSAPKGLLGGTSTPSAEGTKTAFMEEGAAPLLAGLAGGVGGYAGAKHLLNPLLKLKEKGILDQISKGERAVSGLRRAQKLAPLGGAAVGALILAALAARKARRKGQEDMAQYMAVHGQAAGAHQYGVSPYDVVMPNDPRAQVYGNSPRQNFY